MNITLGADKAYDAFDLVQALKERNVTPHIAINGTLSRNAVPRKTAVDRRTTRYPGYAISQCVRKRIEEVFVWVKSTGGLDKLKVRALEKANTAFIMALAAYDLIRLPKLLGATPWSIQGKWRIVERPGYEADFPDTMGPAFILFGKSGGEFAFRCVTGRSTALPTVTP